MTRTTKLLMMNKMYVRKVTASEALDSLDAEEYFAEIHGDKR